jgi:hypothetical protein
LANETSRVFGVFAVTVDIVDDSLKDVFAAAHNPDGHVIFIEIEVPARSSWFEGESSLG